MSYILEALKKSEEARQRQPSVATPILPRSARPTAAHKPTAQTMLLLILTIVFGGYLLAAGYYFFSQPQQKTIAQDASSTMANRNSAPSGKSSTNKASKSNTSIPELYPHSKKTAFSPHTPTTNGEILQPRPLATTLPSQQERSPSLAEQQTPTIPYLEELAPSFQESIPDLQLAGHVFSAAPHLRMIVINNAIVREKDVVTQDLVLEEITQDGIILRSANKRFRLDAQ